MDSSFGGRYGDSQRNSRNRTEPQRSYGTPNCADDGPPHSMISVHKSAAIHWQSVLFMTQTSPAQSARAAVADDFSDRGRSIPSVPNTRYHGARTNIRHSTPNSAVAVVRFRCTGVPNHLVVPNGNRGTGPAITALGCTQRNRLLSSRNIVRVRDVYFPDQTQRLAAGIECWRIR